MAKQVKDEAEKEPVKAKKASVKTKEFKLKQDHEGKKAGDTIKVGPNGERFYKRKNII